MSDTNPNTSPDLERLTAFVGEVRKALNLDDAADEAAITSALGTRLGDAAAAVERAKTIEQTWASEKITSALTTAYGRAGAKPEHLPDFMLLTKDWFELKDGHVVTRAGVPNVAEGCTPEQAIQGFVKSMRPAYWPLSVSGGSKGAGFAAHTGPDLSCFKGGTMTDQMSMVARVGEKAVLDSLKRAGITPPPWLKGGGR